jgi:hypothetical protein
MPATWRANRPPRPQVSATIGGNAPAGLGQELELHDLAAIVVQPFSNLFHLLGSGRMKVISLNWKGTPLVSYETVVKLIGGTTTKTGLKVKARLDSISISHWTKLFSFG